MRPSPLYDLESARDPSLLLDQTHMDREVSEYDVGVGSSPRVISNLDLFAAHGHRQRRLNPEADLVATDAQDRYADVVTDANP